MKANIILLILGLLFSDGVSFVLAQKEQGSLTAALEDFSHLNDGQKNIILSSVGVPDASSFSLSKIIGCLVFNGVGFIAFFYGKKQGSFKPLLIGISLMAYPYFLTSTFWLYAVGVALCLLLYFWRD